MKLHYKRICTLLFLFLDLFPNLQAYICQTCLCSIEDDTTIHIDCHAKFADADVLQNGLKYAEYNETLSILNLSQNNITHLANDMLENSKHLRHIDLSFNLLEEIHEDSFKNLKSLRTLILSHNNIKSFKPTILPSLLIMDLSNNKISDLNVEFHKAYPQLSVLNLSHNELDDFINATLTLLENLSSLDLSYNKFRLLDGEDFSSLKQLRVLNLSHNAIQSLENQKFPDSLLEINVGFNSLAVFPSTIKRVRKLNIENNKICNIIQNTSAITNQLGEIQYLNLSGNLMEEFPNLTLTNLSALDLSYNNFTNIPETLKEKNYPALQTLIFNGNSIKNLEFISDLRLTSLVVSNANNLVEINENAFKKLNNYNGSDCLNLTLTHNKELRFLHNKALQHLNLCFLDLRNNNFSHLSPKFLDYGLKAKNGIDLEGNPFHCNCSLQWMLNTLIPWLYKTNSNLLENLRCETPENLHGRRMVHWYNWKEPVLCEEHQRFSSRMIGTVEVLGSSEQITLHTSHGMVIAIVTALSILLILVVLGIVLARRVGSKLRRVNRRF